MAEHLLGEEGGVWLVEDVGFRATLMTKLRQGLKRAWAGWFLGFRHVRCWALGRFLPWQHCWEPPPITLVVNGDGQWLPAPHPPGPRNKTSGDSCADHGVFIACPPAPPAPQRQPHSSTAMSS